MKQFDLLPNPDTATARYSPYLVVLQSHHLDPLDTVMLAPVISDARRPVTPVDVPIEVAGEQLTIAVAEAAGVPRSRYAAAIGSAATHEDQIRRALERIFTGF